MHDPHQTVPPRASIPQPNTIAPPRVNGNGTTPAPLGPPRPMTSYVPPHVAPHAPAVRAIGVLVGESIEFVQGQ